MQWDLGLQGIGVLAPRALVGCEVHDGGARLDAVEHERHLRFAARPQERVAARLRGLAVEALGLGRLGGRRAEEEDLPRRPPVRDGQARGEVVGQLVGGRPARDDEGYEEERGRADYFTFVPGGTSASNVQSTALPSSDAASTIPNDSTPMSFAGFRFATRTTFLPTSDSGA